MSGIRTEIELRFIIDVTHPLSPAERVITSEALELLKRSRAIRKSSTTGDIEAIERQLRMLDDGVASKESMTPELKVQRQITEQKAIMRALESAGWNQTRAAAVLGIARPTLSEKMRQYGIGRPRKEDS